MKKGRINLIAFNRVLSSLQKKYTILLGEKTYLIILYFKIKLKIS
jgi:hypothetical protein